VLACVDEVELALMLEDVDVELTTTERFRIFEMLLAWASSTVTWQGAGDGVAEAVTGQVCKPPGTLSVATVL
jgi:hypothetical protein